MASLTKTQLDHAKGKVQTAATKKIDEFKKTLGARPLFTDFTSKEKEAFIRAGKAILKDGASFDSYGYLGSSFNFPDTPAMKKQRKLCEAWDAEVKKESLRIEGIKDRLIDELVMSPDGMEALNKIALAFD